MLKRKGNWNAWSLKIRAHLDAKTEPLSRYLVNPPENDDESRQRDRQVKVILLMAVEDDVTSIIGQAAFAHEAYTRLTNDMQAHRNVRQMELRQRVSKFAQTPTQTVETYTQCVNELMSEAVDLSHYTSASMICAIFIGGLRDDIRHAIGSMLLQTLNRHQVTDLRTAQTALQALVKEAKYSSSVLVKNIVDTVMDDRASVAFQVHAQPRHSNDQMPWNQQLQGNQQLTGGQARNQQHQRPERQPRDGQQQARGPRQKVCRYCEEGRSPEKGLPRLSQGTA